MITSLLTTGGTSCLICGSRSDARMKGGFASLCQACYRSIPWIVRVHCPVCGRPAYCPDCIRRTHAAIIVNRSAVRYDAIIREWLAMYKYRGHEALEPLLGEMLTVAYRGLQAEYARQAPDAAPLRFDAVIPVPVSEPRLLERGFNQAERLAARLAASNQLPLHDLLRRTRHSSKQSIKSRGDRLRDTRNLFATDGPAWERLIRDVQVFQSSAVPPIFHCRLLLIDDIYTTGSTVHACAEALAAAMRQSRPGAKLEIYCLTLARS